MGKIYMTGTRSQIGSVIYKYLQERNLDIIPIERKDKLNKSTLLWNFYSRNTRLKFNKCDWVIHCSFNFSDNSLSDNSNIQAALNIKKKFNKIINISTLSCYEESQSNYGKIKYKIEQIFNNRTSINLRLGVPLSNPPISFLKMLKKFSFIPFMPAIDTYIYTTDMNYFCSLIYKAIKNEVKLKNVCSVVSSKNYFPEFIKKHTNRNCLVVNWKLIYILLKIINTIGLKTRFNSDSIIGLVHYNKKIKNSI